MEVRFRKAEAKTEDDENSDGDNADKEWNKVKDICRHSKAA